MKKKRKRNTEQRSETAISNIQTYHLVFLYEPPVTVELNFSCSSPITCPFFMLSVSSYWEGCPLNLFLFFETQRRWSIRLCKWWHLATVGADDHRHCNLILFSSKWTSKDVFCPFWYSCKFICSPFQQEAFDSFSGVSDKIRAINHSNHTARVSSTFTLFDKCSYLLGQLQNTTRTQPIVLQSKWRA